MKGATATLWGCGEAGPAWIPVTIIAKRWPGGEGAMASPARVTELSQRETVWRALAGVLTAFPESSCCEEGDTGFPGKLGDTKFEF